MSEQPFQLLHGDCLQLMREIPDKSVDAVVCDPPYSGVKSHAWDNQWGNNDLFLKWFFSVGEILNQKCKPTASVYLFAKQGIVPWLAAQIHQWFPFQSEIVWKKLFANKGQEGWKNKCKKSSLRRLYPSSERILFHARDNYPIQIKEARTQLGISVKQLTEELGAYGAVNNGGQVSNWENGLNFPPVKFLSKLEKILGVKLEKPHYYDAMSFSSFEDILEYHAVPQEKGKHPCEKPLPLISDMVRSITRVGDTVLDFTMGSGTTGVACLNTGRKFIGIEMDDGYFQKAKERIEKRWSELNTVIPVDQFELTLPAHP
jgi:adenine-specific DNA-methyltransferase